MSMYSICVISHCVMVSLVIVVAAFFSQEWSFPSHLFSYKIRGLVAAQPCAITFRERTMKFIY